MLVLCIKETSGRIRINQKNIHAKICKKCMVKMVEWDNKKHDYSYELNDSWTPPPIYKNYYCNKFGMIINNKTKKLIGSFTFNGYISVSVKNCTKCATIRAHRFIWESLRGTIPEGKVINHINEQKSDNRICNLEMVSLSENAFKSSNKSTGRLPSKEIIATNSLSKSQSFKSAYYCGKLLGICDSSILKCANGLCNTAVSKIDNSVWTFSYK